MDGARGCSCLRMAIPGAMVAFDHRDGATRGQHAHQRAQGPNGFGQMLQHKADEDVVEGTIEEGQLKDIRVLERDVSVASDPDASAGLPDSSKREIKGDDPGPG